MRLTTDFFAAALMRRIRGQGGFAYLVRRGAEAAGALFILNHLKGQKVDLYGPAPQNFYTEAGGGERLFICHMQEAEVSQAKDFLEKELAFDPDIWLIEVEDFAADWAELIKMV